jgi:hypothetical protein
MMPSAFEVDLHAGATKVLMKLDSSLDIELDRSEFARHRAALAEFARLHLTAMSSLMDASGLACAFRGE